MSDLISRQDAIDAIQNQAIHMPEALNDIGIAYYEGLHYAFQVISMLPSAEHEQKTSKWGCTLIEGRVMCLNCGTRYDWDSHAQYYNYCPNCGVRIVRGERDE